MQRNSYMSPNFLSPNFLSPNFPLQAAGAGDAGAGQAAVAARVLGQVLLVVVLGEIERRLVGDLGGDGAVAGPGQLGLEQLARLQRLFALGGRRRVDGAAVLRSDVV